MRLRSVPLVLGAAWEDIMNNKSDPRTTNWCGLWNFLRNKSWKGLFRFMMSSPLPTIAVALGYIVSVKVRILKMWFKFLKWSDEKISQIIGPRLMANRKPFNVRNLQLWYNIVHLLINIFLFHEASMTGWLTGENSFRCQPVDFSNTGVPYRVALKHLHLNYIKIRFLIDRSREAVGFIISANSRTSLRLQHTFWWKDSTWSICTT